MHHFHQIAMKCIQSMQFLINGMHAGKQPGMHNAHRQAGRQADLLPQTLATSPFSINVFS